MADKKEKHVTKVEGLDDLGERMGRLHIHSKILESMKPLNKGMKEESLPKQSLVARNGQTVPSKHKKHHVSDSWKGGPEPRVTKKTSSESKRVQNAHRSEQTNTLHMGDSAPVYSDKDRGPSCKYVSAPVFDDDGDPLSSKDFFKLARMVQHSLAPKISSSTVSAPTIEELRAELAKRKAAKPKKTTTEVSSLEENLSNKLEKSVKLECNQPPPGDLIGRGPVPTNKQQERQCYHPYGSPAQKRQGHGSPTLPGSGARQIWDPTAYSPEMIEQYMPPQNVLNIGVNAGPNPADDYGPLEGFVPSLSVVSPQMQGQVGHPVQGNVNPYPQLNVNGGQGAQMNNGAVLVNANNNNNNIYYNEQQNLDGVHDGPSPGYYEMMGDMNQPQLRHAYQVQQNEQQVAPPQVNNQHYIMGPIAIVTPPHSCGGSPSSNVDMGGPPTDDEAPGDELPADLTDFILQYSRRYSIHSSSSSDSGSDSEASSQKSPQGVVGRQQSMAQQGQPFRNVGIHAAPSTAPNISPDIDRRAMTGSREHGKQHRASVAKSAGIARSMTPPQIRRRIGCVAKQKLRSLLTESQFEAGWIWAAKCWRGAPQALCFLRDSDGDSFLHRVVYHKDLSKIYGLVEHMLKEENPLCPKPYDLPNSSNETPLFVAVQRRMDVVVDYLLECGATPNIQLKSKTGDTPLHYAASRGMTEIVSLLCKARNINIDPYNSQGFTPLMCAIRYHGVIEEESQCLVNNKPVIRTLLSSGADPTIPDASQYQRSIVHLAVEKMDFDLIEIFKQHITSQNLEELVNTLSADGFHPLDLLDELVSNLLSVPLPNVDRLACESNQAQSEANVHPANELKLKMTQALVTCGARENQST